MTPEELRTLYAIFACEWREPRRFAVVRELIRRCLVKPTATSDPKTQSLTFDGIRRAIDIRISDDAAKTLKGVSRYTLKGEPLKKLTAQQAIQLEDEGLVYYHEGAWRLSVLGYKAKNNRHHTFTLHIEDELPQHTIAEDWRYIAPWLKVKD